MIQFFEEDTEATDKRRNSLDTKKDKKHRHKSPIIFRARKASEYFTDLTDDRGSDHTTCGNRAFVTAVSKVRLGLRVLRGFQFYTSRSLARAIGQSTTIKEEHLISTELGLFPTLLQKICQKIRPEDQCFMVVELTSTSPDTMLHYLVMIRHRNSAGEKEDLLLGAEVTMENNTVKDVRFVLSIPLLSNVRVHLHGENRFIIETPQASYLLKPSTLQSQWAAITFLAGSILHAQDRNMFQSGNTHSWCRFYNNNEPLDVYWRQKCRSVVLEEHIARHVASVADIASRLGAGGVGVEGGGERGRGDPVTKTTHLVEDVPRKRRKSSPPADLSSGKHYPVNDRELCKLKLKLIQNEIRNVMHTVDPDVASCRSIRAEVEDNLGTDLYELREWMNEQILLIYGQMDEPSHVLDYLLLGTEWNACNLEELLDNGVTHILNTTHDIDCFFKDQFKYHRVNVEDTPEANLLQHWQTTYDFIKDCKNRNGKILVHCQRGISRSASTTIAYLMKEYNSSLEEALRLTTSQRSCVKPNSGFHKQLHTYEELLRPSKLSSDLSNVLNSTIVHEL